MLNSNRKNRLFKIDCLQHKDFVFEMLVKRATLMNEVSFKLKIRSFAAGGNSMCSPGLCPMSVTIFYHLKMITFFFFFHSDNDVKDTMKFPQKLSHSAVGKWLCWQHNAIITTALMTFTTTLH